MLFDGWIEHRFDTHDLYPHRHIENISIDDFPPLKSMFTVHSTGISRKIGHCLIEIRLLSADRTSSLRRRPPDTFFKQRLNDKFDKKNARLNAFFSLHFNLFSTHSDLNSNGVFLTKHSFNRVLSNVYLHFALQLKKSSCSLQLPSRAHFFMLANANALKRNCFFFPLLRLNAYSYELQIGMSMGLLFSKTCL